MHIGVYVETVSPPNLNSTKILINMKENRENYKKFPQKEKCSCKK